MILSHLLRPEILEMIEEGQLNELREFLSNQPAPEIAELIVAVDDRDRLLLFRILPRHLADELFSLLDAGAQNLLLDNMAQEEIRGVLRSLTPDDRTALFEELPAQVTQRLLGLLSDADRQKALQLLSYPEDSVGRLMTDRYVKVRPEWTVAETINFIRQHGTDSETIAMVYITDDKGRLVDDLRLRKLILSDPGTHVSDLLDGQFVALTSRQDREEAVQMFKKYDLYALPVIDADGVLLGIVTVDDILDVAEEESTEDFHKLGTVRPLEMSLREATFGLLFRKRIGWLLALVVVNIFAGMGIALFESTILSVVALVFFLPLLVDSGGNAGAQSSTLVVRAMATGEIGRDDWWRLFSREVSVSAVIGFSMAAATFLLGLWRGGLLVAVVVSVSMVAVVMSSSLMGLLLPMVLNKLKLDPATASAPLVTSLADIVGVLIYLSIARAMLGT
jgi:magnesium transporter